MGTDSAEAPPGLRERNKRDKESRILAAATRLFAERGYEAVTTQEIADAADVGTGTLFRYVGSKAELLVMVMNERLRLGTEAAIARASEGAEPADAILTMLAPLLDENAGHPGNTLAYQRETLFGTGPQRDIAAQRVAQLEVAIRTILELHAARGAARPEVDLGSVAHAVYATVYMDVVQVEVRHGAMSELPARIRRSIDFLVAHLIGQ
jgi:TetR/AcrR family transcriptional regulator, cholesterol catabolism regulator